MCAESEQHFCGAISSHVVWFASLAALTVTICVLLPSGDVLVPWWSFIRDTWDNLTRPVFMYLCVLIGEWTNYPFFDRFGLFYRLTNSSLYHSIFWVANDEFTKYSEIPFGGFGKCWAVLSHLCFWPTCCFVLVRPSRTRVSLPRQCPERGEPSASSKTVTHVADCKCGVLVPS